MQRSGEISVNLNYKKKRRQARILPYRYGGVTVSYARLHAFSYKRYVDKKNDDKLYRLIN